MAMWPMPAEFFRKPKSRHVKKTCRVQEKDLSSWAKESLPEYLSGALQDSHGAVLTPWSSFEVRLSHVEVSGEAGLCGRKGKAVLQFDLDIGAQLDILKATRLYGLENAEGSWQAILRIHFEPGAPEIQVQFDDPRTEVASEVTWFFQKGLGSRLLLNALSRWHAAAEPGRTESITPVSSDAFQLFQQRLSSMQKKPQKPRKLQTSSVHWTCEQRASQLQKVSAVGDATRYPWPSAVAGVYGPANQADSSAGHTPSQPSQPPSRKAEKLDRAKKLHEAIAFKLLGSDIVNIPVGDEGLPSIHSAIQSGSPDMLAMVIKAQADVGRKDALGRIPLMMALKRGSIPLTKQLLEVWTVDCGLVACVHFSRGSLPGGGLRIGRRGSSRRIAQGEAEPVPGLPDSSRAAGPHRHQGEATASWTYADQDNSSRCKDCGSST
eukprot:symbB.v1.2.028409.t1/scaffold3009.1/size65478/8